jgi:hypothetical protein
MWYCTQGFNTFLTALKGGVLNPFGTNKKTPDHHSGYYLTLSFAVIP